MGRLVILHSKVREKEVVNMQVRLFAKSIQEFCE
jgi:hypothetical protein